MSLAVLESEDICSDRPVEDTVNFYDFSRDALEHYLKDKYDLPAFRAKQLYEWVYKRGVKDISQMSNISKDLRDKLELDFSFHIPSQKKRLISKDGTRKYLFEVGNGDLVETVMIKQENRMTLCVSSQVGCAIGCKFCQTGTMGLKRHLKASEIIGQVVGVVEDAKEFGDMFSNIVFMGMGEPLHNYDNLISAVKTLLDPYAFNLGGRKITISTSGLLPQMKRLFDEDLGVSLAVSLNATTEESRTDLMPINKRYPLEKLLQTLRELPLKKKKKITIEYVMLGGVNDSEADMKRMPKLMHGLPVKVNLIPYNFNSGLGYKCPAEDVPYKWLRYLSSKGIVTTVRWSKGPDIDAACGQLATQSSQ